jgi:hypothetical protein
MSKYMKKKRIVFGLLVLGGLIGLVYYGSHHDGLQNLNLAVQEHGISHRAQHALGDDLLDPLMVWLKDIHNGE